MTDTKKLPSILSFERKLEPSDGLMFSGNWEDRETLFLEDKTGNKTFLWHKIAISTRKNRSTQSACGIEDKKKSQPNPVASDSDDANLPYNHDTLKVSFTLRIIGDLGVPFACNEPDFEKAFTSKIDEFKTGNGLQELAFRYAYNIANGRFLWRNRVGAENVSIHTLLSDKGDNHLEFNAYDFSLMDFVKNSDHQDIKKLAAKIFEGLNGHNDFVCITVNAFVKLGVGQHVFPSQEMNIGEGKKTLFQLADGAALHNVKIGNALRTIDSWYKGGSEPPIAAEPYGSVTQRGQAYRPSKNDLYTLILDWLNGKEVTQNDRCYVVANLIRGGLFQGKST